MAHGPAQKTGAEALKFFYGICGKATDAGVHRAALQWQGARHGFIFAVDEIDGGVCCGFGGAQ